MTHPEIDPDRLRHVVTQAFYSFNVVRRKDLNLFINFAQPDKATDSLNNDGPERGRSTFACVLQPNVDQTSSCSTKIEPLKSDLFGPM